MFDYTLILFSLILTVFIYVVPIAIYRFIKGPQTFYASHRIAFFYSIIIGVLFVAYRVSEGIDGKSYAAFFYYFINKSILRFGYNYENENGFSIDNNYKSRGSTLFTLKNSDCDSNIDNNQIVDNPENINTNIEVNINKSKTLICPTCSHLNYEENKNCSNCGNQFISKRYCHNCGEKITGVESICLKCGVKL